MNVVIYRYVCFRRCFSHEITPLSAEVHVLEGSYVAEMSCNYSGNNILAFQWYKQDPDSAPESLPHIFKNIGHHNDGLRITVQKDLKRLDVEIFNPAETDSALCCTLVTTLTGTTTTLYKN